MENSEQSNAVSSVLDDEEPTKVDEVEKDDDITNINSNTNLPIKKRRHTISSASATKEEKDEAEPSVTLFSTNISTKVGRKRASSVVSVPVIIDLTGIDDSPGTVREVVDLTKEDPPTRNKPCSNDAYHTIQCVRPIARFTLKYARLSSGQPFPITVFVTAKPNGIHLSGPKEDVRRANAMLQSIKWYDDALLYNCPKLSTYFDCDSWKDFVKVLESEIRCTIEVKSQEKTGGAQRTYSLEQDTDLSFIQTAPDATANHAQAEQSSDPFIELFQDAGIPTNVDANQANMEHAAPFPQTPAGLTSNHNSADQLFEPQLLQNSTQEQQDGLRPQSNPGRLLNAVTSQTKYGNISVVVSHGDISQDNSAAIVNGVNSNFDLSFGAISKSIVKAAGVTIVQACMCADSSNPLLRVTGGYGLQCRYVFHLVTPRDIGDYVRSLEQVFKCAEKFQLPSIALPALGTGEIGLDPLQVSYRTVEAINAFVASLPRYVRTIKLVIFDMNLFFIFRSNVVTSKAVADYGDRKAVEVEHQILNMNLSHSMTVTIYSDHKTSVEVAKGRIQKHMEKCIRKKVISNELIMKVNPHDCIDIYRASVAFSADVIYRDSRITLVGLPDHLDQLHDFVRRIGFEIREAETLSKVCSWQWETGFNCFEDLPVRVSAELERLYERSLQDKLITSAEIGLYGEKFRVDFVSMIYEFISVFGRIRRFSQQSELPRHWDDMQGNSLALVPLNPHVSTEYANVVNQFLNSNPTFKSIVQIDRIQNPALYKQYMLKKVDVQAHMSSSRPVERNLFHGTSEADAMKICTDGFDRGFAGKNATMYGKGTYFAVNSAYSMQFAHGPKGSVRKMFLASVLTGDYCQGSSDFKAAPEKNGAPNSRRYDSVVDRVDNPSMYIVFKDSSVYPSYLIHFL